MNLPTDQQLWQRLRDFQITDDYSSAFINKLCQQQGWNRDFAEQALLEYKRFIYLAATGNTRVVPSNAVDQVWHLHLVYTQSYWQGMCDQLIGRPIHHHPSETDERSKQRNQQDYLKTLANYQQTFGIEPDTKVWPRPKQSRVTKIRGWPWLLLSTVVLTACIRDDAGNLDWVSIAKWAFGLYVAYRVLKWLGSGSGRGGSGSGSGCGSSCGGD